MLTASELKAFLKSHGLRLTKRLGQHHLIDARVAARIVEAVRVGADETVVEIGPGLGALTELLARRGGCVIAVEIDQRIAALLAERLRAFPNVSVVCQDILAFAWERAGRVSVVGAIPYHVTSPIIVWLCEHRGAIREAVLVLQREVAERLCAKPGTKAYGRLSVLVQYGWEVSSLFTIPPGCFFPQPAVASSCVRFISRSSPAVAVDDEQVFFAVVRAAFAHRRKTLVNCLSRDREFGSGRREAEALLEELDLPRDVRGERLSLAEFAKLANSLR